MDWINAVLGIGSAAATGGLFGIIGGAFNRLFDWLAIKEKLKADQARYDHEVKILEMETQRDIVIAKEEANARREVAEMGAMAASYEADRATYFTPSMAEGLPSWAKGTISALMAIVDFVRGMTRPTITLAMCIVTALLYQEVRGVLTTAGAQPLSKEMAFTLYVKIVETVLFLTTMAVGWWFATRAKDTRDKGTS